MKGYKVAIYMKSGNVIYVKCVIASYIRPCDQSIQPWQFGHEEKKRICLWLKNLDLLKTTKIMKKRKPRIHYMGSHLKNRPKERSRFYKGIASAMAEQWGNNV